MTNLGGKRTLKIGPETDIRLWDLAVVGALRIGQADKLDLQMQADINCLHATAWIAALDAG